MVVQEECDDVIVRVTNYAGNQIAAVKLSHSSAFSDLQRAVRRQTGVATLEQRFALQHGESHSSEGFAEEIANTAQLSALLHGKENQHQSDSAEITLVLCSERPLVAYVVKPGYRLWLRDDAMGGKNGLVLDPGQEFVCVDPCCPDPEFLEVVDEDAPLGYQTLGWVPARDPRLDYGPPTCIASTEWEDFVREESQVLCGSGRQLSPLVSALVA